MNTSENNETTSKINWGSISFLPEIGWTMDTKNASDEEICDLISTNYGHFKPETIKKAVFYLKSHWNTPIEKSELTNMTKKIIEFENVIQNNENISHNKDDNDNGELYCLLGELYGDKNEIPNANYYYQKSAILGFPKGEERLGIAYHKAYQNIDKNHISKHSNITMLSTSKKQALFWLNRALNNGVKEASEHINEIQKHCEIAKTSDDYETNRMIDNIEDGYSSQHFELACIYHAGDKTTGIPVDYEEAAYWYKKSLYIVDIKTNICLTIAKLYENQLDNEFIALNYYRKAYLMDDIKMSVEERKKLLSKIQSIFKTLIPCKDKFIADTLESFNGKNPFAKTDKFNTDEYSDDEIRSLCSAIDYIPEITYEERTDEDEKTVLLRRIPLAQLVVHAAFNNRPVAENALGVFYENGVILPMDLDKAEYWYLCAYTDGYEVAYKNLERMLSDKMYKPAWRSFIALAARHGIEDARKKCDDLRIDYSKNTTTENNMLEIYNIELLAVKEPTERERELIEQFLSIDNVHFKRDILIKLAPVRVFDYVDVYLNAIPYVTEHIIDKLMDTDDLKLRRKIIDDSEIEMLNGIKISDEILQEIPYMPLTDKEKQYVMVYSKREHKRSPYRKAELSHKFESLMEKEKTVIKIMDAEHRLTFDVANMIVDEYEKRFLEEIKNRKPSNEPVQDDRFKFWTLYGLDSIYAKRIAYTQMLLKGEEIIEDNLQKIAVNNFWLNLNEELNPILRPLLSMASVIYPDDMLKRI